MLIKSHRHTAADLRLWDELLELDRLHAQDAGYKMRKELTLENIRNFIAKDRPYYAALSWGKDSVVLAHMFHTLGAQCVYAYMINELREPEGNKAVRDVFLDCHKINYSEMRYTYEHADKTFFGRDKKHVKWLRIREDLQRKYGVHVTGVRADESAQRKMRFLHFGLETKNSFAPFARFNCQDVFAYLYEHDLPVHPNYAMLGGGRWDKYKLRVAAVGHCEGDGMGRREWEREYYGDILNRTEACYRRWGVWKGFD